MQRDAETVLAVVDYIADVRENAPADYRARKEGGPLDGQAERFDSPPISVEAQPRLRIRDHGAMDGYVRNAAGVIDEKYPLLSGEVVEADFDSFLAEPFFHFPAGTAVIRRTTNMADLYYLIPGIVVDADGEIVRREPERVEAPRAAPGMPLAATIPPIATTIATKLAHGMVSAIGGAIANKILSDLFPPGEPQYFEEVYKNLARIVREELQADRINTIEDKIKSIKEDLTIEYNPKLDGADLTNPETRKELKSTLDGINNHFGELLATLERYPYAGFGLYLMAASLRLSIYQEMARVASEKDSVTKQFLPPDQNSYGRPGKGSVAEAAKTYVDKASRLWPRVQQQRTSGIFPLFWTNVRGHWGAIDDNGEKKHERQLRTAYLSQDRKKVEEETERYRSAAAMELNYNHGYPNGIPGYAEGIIPAWRKLIDTPIPR